MENLYIIIISIFCYLITFVIIGILFWGFFKDSKYHHRIKEKFNLKKDKLNKKKDFNEYKIKLSCFIMVFIFLIGIGFVIFGGDWIFDFGGIVIVLSLGLGMAIFFYMFDFKDRKVETLNKLIEKEIKKGYY